jgi:hypothetical protein
MLPYSLLPAPIWWIKPLLALLVACACFYAGMRYSDNACVARQAQQLRAQEQALQAEVQRSQVAATQSIAAQQALQKDYTVLKEKFDVFTNRGPLVVWRAGAACPGAGADAPAGAVGAAEPDRAPAERRGAAADAVSLSVGAVWLWNSALAGTDSPVGACGAANPASPACAVDAGLRLEAAWANHTANAQACASDRLRHQRLIDYLAAAQGTP